MKMVKLAWLGVTDDMDYDFRRVTLLSNVIYLLIFGIVALYLLVNSPKYLAEPGKWTIARMVPLLLLVVCMMGLWLNHRRWYLVSKVLFTLSWIFLTLIFVPITMGATEPSFISAGIYAIISSVLVHILFSWRREKTTYISLVVITWTIVLFFVEYLEYFRVEGNQNILFTPGFTAWRLLVVLIAIFFNASIVYMVWVNRQLNESLIHRNQTIEEQNRQLAAQREQLVDLATKLQQKVESTHVQLNQQSNKLTEYTFFNSHILRAPVSRIQGLVHLLSTPLDKRDDAEVRNMLTKSMDELDDAIRSITQKLNEDGGPTGEGKSQ